MSPPLTQFKKLQKLRRTISDEINGAGRFVTRDQLHALCIAGREQIDISRFTRVLHAMVSDGIVGRSFDADCSTWRYHHPREHYRLRQVIDSWHVDRRLPGAHAAADQWFTIMTGTEREARVCLAALQLDAIKWANRLEAIRVKRAAARVKR